MFEFWSPSKPAVAAVRPRPSSKVPPTVTLGPDQFTLLATLQLSLRIQQSIDDSDFDPECDSPVSPMSPTFKPSMVYPTPMAEIDEISISTPTSLWSKPTLSAKLREQGKLTLTFAMRNYGSAFSNEQRIDAANRLEAAISGACGGSEVEYRERVYRVGGMLAADEGEDVLGGLVEKRTRVGDIVVW